MEQIRLTFMTIPREPGPDSSLNLRYRIPIYGQIFEYLRRLSSVEARFFDAGIAGLSFDGCLEELASMTPDLVVLWCDVKDAQAAKRFAGALKQESTDTKILVIGSGPAFIPQYFERFPFDAVWLDGDFEICVESYIEFLRSSDPKQVRGLSFSDGGGFTRKAAGTVLPSHKLVLPNLEHLPMNAYRRIWAKCRPTRPFEVTIGPVRGCARRCRYCEVPRVARGVVRSIDSRRVYNWLEENLQSGDMVQLVAPNIATDRQWLMDFSGLAASGTFVWKAAVTLSDLDEELIALMAHGHCRYLGYGIETISAWSKTSPKISLSELKRLSALLGAHGIKQKAFIMIGYPGQTADDVAFTLETLLELGISIRPTGYTPFEKLTHLQTDALDKLDLRRYDKQTFYDPDIAPMDKETFWNILRGNFEAALKELGSAK